MKQQLIIKKSQKICNKTEFADGVLSDLEKETVMSAVTRGLEAVDVVNWWPFVDF